MIVPMRKLLAVLLVSAVAAGLVGAIAPSSSATPANVTISSFTAKCATKGTTVAWRTAVENSLLGFNLFRLQGKKQTKVNKAIVPAKAVGRAGGAKYSFADKAAKKNTKYSYKLQIIDLTGLKRFVGTTALKKKCVASPLAQR